MLTTAAFAISASCELLCPLTQTLVFLISVCVYPPTFLSMFPLLPMEFNTTFDAYCLIPSDLLCYDAHSFSDAVINPFIINIQMLCYDTSKIFVSNLVCWSL